MTIRDRIVEMRRIAAKDLIPNPKNWRRHPPAQVAALRGMFAEVGIIDVEIGIEVPEGVMLIDGHARRDLVDPDQLLPVLILDLEIDEADMVLASLDPLAAMATPDAAALSSLLDSLQPQQDAVIKLLSGLEADSRLRLEAIASGGGDDADDAVKTARAIDRKASEGKLRERFIAPPFSVLDARSGWWVARKKAWLALGIESELGRGASVLEPDAAAGTGQQQHVKGPLIKADSANDPYYYSKKRGVERELGREISTAEFQETYYTGPHTYQAGISIFDPVLCELVYRWFLPADGVVLDPFAGGSVRGLVAGWLGHDYHGVELQPQQLAANERQREEILAGRKSVGRVEWVPGDSRKLNAVLPEPSKVDLIFSCPPYFDLEQYTDDPADLANAATYEEFLKSYRRIIKLAVGRLRQNRFACFVVGEIRDDDGAYRNLVGDTVEAFVAAGAAFYNEGILVQQLGSWPIRIGRMFSSTRKLGHAHQNVLVFVKGDPRKATAACGDVQVIDIGERT